MGYAVIMFVILLLMAVSIALSANYGISKDSQEAPLLAENAYAEREGGKMQTGLTIINTCLSNPGRYLAGQGGATYGPHDLYLTIRNNGSIVLNSTKATILYNKSYVKFMVTSEIVWAPLKNTSLKVSNLYIIPGNGSITDPGQELTLLVAAENGIVAIAPTSPINFTGGTDKNNGSFIFNWNPSKDDKGIDYYLLYSFEGGGTPASCPVTGAKISPPIAGNLTTSLFTEAQICDGGCQNTWFFLVAVDIDGNMGIPSRTLKCPPGNGVSCGY